MLQDQFRPSPGGFAELLVCKACLQPPRRSPFLADQITSPTSCPFLFPPSTERMAPWWLCLLLFAGLWKTSLQEDLEGYSFVFSHKGYVTLEMEQPQDLLQNITICLCSFSDSPAKQALFSYATRDQDKEILIYKVHGLDGFWWYTVYIGGVPQRFRVPDSYQDWQQICIKWSSETGVLTFEFNRRKLARKVVRQGYFIRPHALVQLGRAHHEDIFFQGEIQQVYMWNSTVNDFSRYNPSMIGWNNLSYETQGNVVLDSFYWPPSTCPM